MNPTDAQYNDTVTQLHEQVTLPFTGMDLLILAGVAIALVIIGIAMIRLVKRNQTS